MKWDRSIGQSPVFALSLLTVAMGLIPLNDALFKLLSDHLSLGQLIAIRAIVTLALLGVFTRTIGAMLALSAAVFWQFFGRAACLIVAMTLFFISLGTLPLANVIAIFFVAPMIITLLSVPLLGETIGRHRVAAFSAGMIGVLLIVQPGSAAFQPESLLVFLAALSYAAFQIWTRRLKDTGDLGAMVAVQHLSFLLAGTVMLAGNWWWPVPTTGNASVDFLFRAPAAFGLMELVYLVFCAMIVLFLSFASSHAYRTVEASAIAPFEYVAIPSSVVWGVLIWNDWPNALALAGMGLILAGGLYRLFREQRRAVDAVPTTPTPAKRSGRK